MKVLMQIIQSRRTFLTSLSTIGVAGVSLALGHRSLTSRRRK
jgi:hypothetical protein